MLEGACLYKKFIDKTGREKEKRTKRRKVKREAIEPKARAAKKEEMLEKKPIRRKADRKRWKQNKGAWGMPWLPEATKDVVSCEKRRGGANDP